MESFAAKISTASFPDSIKSLLQTVDQMAFDFSVQGPLAIRAEISNLADEDLCGQAAVDQAMVDCCRSGLLLLYGHLNESHEISQSVHSAEGSYWHGLMHRAESDFWNSKYWYSKAGDNHPVVTKMREHDSLWSGDSFVDLCQKASESGDDGLVKKANHLARCEWFFLFQHCWSAANAS